MILPRDTVMSFNGTRVTEHNRESITITPNRIEKANRMADGTLRKNVVATKESYSVSWSMVPSQTARTVDGYLGANGIIDFYNTTTGSFTLTLRYDALAGGTITKTVMFSGTPSYEIVGRSTAGFDLVNLSIEMEEV